MEREGQIADSYLDDTREASSLYVGKWLEEKEKKTLVSQLFS